ncbi:MAG: hypothetical protein R3C19_23340 [Planctomycetaceae bacterium]
MMEGSHAQVIVSDIKALWQVARPIAEIARNLHLPESIIRHVIATGTLPES